MNTLSLLPKLRPLDQYRLPYVIKLIFSFETAFLLFLFAGRYKLNPYLLPLFPIDPIIIFGLISFCVGLWVIATEKIYVPGLIAVASFSFFVTWMWISFIWTPGIVYARSKAIDVTVIDTLALIAGAVIMANSRERCLRFMVVINIMAVILAMMVFQEFVRRGSGRIILINGGDDYLGYGRVCGLAAMTLFAYLATQARLMQWRSLVVVSLLAFNIWVLLVGGGRGPLIATLIPIALILPLGILVSKRHFLVRRGHLLVAFGLLAALAAIIWILADPELSRTSTTLNRFTRLFSDNQGVSDQRRQMQFWEFLEFSEQAPFIGHGIGSWPILTNGADFRHHPHSLPLEIIGELGLIGLLIFTVFCFTCTRFLRAERLRHDALQLAALLMTLNMALNAGTSGDLAENRYLFLAMGLLLLRPLPDHADQAAQDETETYDDALRTADFADEDDREGYLAVRHRRPVVLDDDPALGRSVTLSGSSL
jgi:O-antigen ligase